MSNQRQETLSQLKVLLFRAVETKNLELVQFFITQDETLAQGGVEKRLEALTLELEQCLENTLIREEKLLVAHGVRSCLIGLEKERDFNTSLKSLELAVTNTLDSYRNRFHIILNDLQVFLFEKPLYWKGLFFNTQYTHGHIKRTDGEALTYSVRLPKGETKVLREQFLLGDGQANLADLGISDKESLTTQLLASLSLPENRRILASEIESALMTLSAECNPEERLQQVARATGSLIKSTTSPSLHPIVQRDEKAASALLTAKWNQLYAELLQKQQEIAAGVRQIKAILQADNARTGYLELNAKALLKWLPKHKSSRITVPDSPLRQALLEEAELRQEMMAYCSSEEVARAYIEEYRQEDPCWLGKGSAKLYALMNNLSLHCFDYVHEEDKAPSIRYDEASSTQSASATKTLYLLYRNNQRFNVLVESDEKGNKAQFYCLQLMRKRSTNHTL